MSCFYPVPEENRPVREIISRARQAHKNMWSPKNGITPVAPAPRLPVAVALPAVSYSKEQARSFMQMAHEELVPAETSRPEPEERYTRDQIIAACAKAGNVTPLQIKSAQRNRNIVSARHVYFYLARNHTTLSFPQIGRGTGFRDHSTVHHGATKIANALEDGDPKFTALVADALAILRGTK